MDPLTDLIIHIAQRLHARQQDHKQQQPTNLRSIATWNVGGWTQPGKAGDEKLKAIKAWLTQGPVALQETHSGQEQATKVVTLIPGARGCCAGHHQKHTPDFPQLISTIIVDPLDSAHMLPPPPVLRSPPRATHAAGSFPALARGDSVSDTIDTPVPSSHKLPTLVLEPGRR